MRKFMLTFAMSTALALVAGVTTASAVDYAAPKPLKDGSQAPIASITATKKPYRIAYMPPATEFNYYVAIGEGIKSVAAAQGVETFMLAPQSGADINGQMGMLQDVLTQNVNAIIFHAHDDGAAAPLIKQAIAKGIAVIIVNSDIPNFPTAVDGVVGYSERGSTGTVAKAAIAKLAGKQANVGIIEGQPGYDSTERVEGFKTGIATAKNFKVVASLDGKWNVEGGNAAAMDMLQAHPEINVVFAANDYMAIGTALAAKAMGRSDLMIFSNDGDTGGMEQIASGDITATSNTNPVLMGQWAAQVAIDALDHKFKGGWVEVPTTIVDKTNAVDVLKKTDMLYPKPSKSY